MVYLEPNLIFRTSCVLHFAVKCFVLRDEMNHFIRCRFEHGHIQVQRCWVGKMCSKGFWKKICIFLSICSFTSRLILFGLCYDATLGMSGIRLESCTYNHEKKTGQQTMLIRIFCLSINDGLFYTCIHQTPNLHWNPRRRDSGLNFLLLPPSKWTFCILLGWW